MNLKKIYKRIKAKFKEVLPQGLTEHNEWAGEILDLYQLPDNDSTRFAIATSILHLPASTVHYSKEYFGNTLRKGASNEVAAFIMQELKAKQKAKIEAEQKAALEVASTSEKV